MIWCWLYICHLSFEVSLHSITWSITRWETPNFHVIFKPCWSMWMVFWLANFGFQMLNKEHEKAEDAKPATVSAASWSWISSVLLGIPITAKAWAYGASTVHRDPHSWDFVFFIVQSEIIRLQTWDVQISLFSIQL